MEKINEKKIKIHKVEKKNNFEKKKKKKRKKKEKKEKLEKKRGGSITMDYCCNPQWFRCGGTVIPPHHLDIVNNNNNNNNKSHLIGLGQVKWRVFFIYSVLDQIWIFLISK